MATIDATATVRPARPLWVVILAAGAIVGLAMGLRQVMGLYLKPISTELGVGREPFSNALAVANLTWGIFAIVAGGIADKYGVGRVLVVCALSTVTSFYLMATAHTPLDLYIAGVLTGIGVAGTGVTALVGAVGRAAPAEKRTAAIASLGMASGIGQLIAFPYAHILIETIGWKASLMVISATCLMILPLAWPLSGKPAAHSGPVRSQSLVEAFHEAFAHPSFWLLVSGFFVCGFHVAFYGVHLPAFVSDLGMPSWVGVWALMAVGIANIVGTYTGRSVGAVRRAPDRAELHLFHARLCVPRAALLAPDADADHRDLGSARAVLAVDRALDVQPRRPVLRHAMDVDAVRLRLPVPSAGLVHRPVARRQGL